MKSFVLLLAVLFVSAPLRAEEDPRPEDFDGAMVLSGREGSLLTLEIPGEVYRGLRRQDLGDIRVFDALGRAVPFGVRGRQKETFTPAPEEVPFFVWDGGPEKNLPAGADIEINTSGSVVRIKNPGGTAGSSRTYLADLSRLEYAPAFLSVTTDSGGKNFNTPVSVHFSGDLSNWKLFEKRQSLASFGETVQDTLELPPLEGIKSPRYLLVAFSADAPPPLAMRALFAPREKPDEYREVRVPGVKSGDGKKVHYNVEGYYPVTSVDFTLAEADSINVMIKTRFNEDDEWDNYSRAALFRYNTEKNGVYETVKNDPFEIPVRAPHWELEAEGEFLFGAVPEMTLRFPVRELVFPARGKGPWTLAYGSAAFALPAGGGSLFPADAETEPAVFTGEARYARTPGGGESPAPYREYILWAFLGAAVIVLSVLAVSIAKSMRK